MTVSRPNLGAHYLGHFLGVTESLDFDARVVARIREIRRAYELDKETPWDGTVTCTACADPLVPRGFFEVAK